MYIADKPEEEIVDCILGQNMIGLLQHIANGTNINQRVQSDKKTLLHAAITVGNANIITCLGINGIDMNRADSKGYAPLHYAFLNGVFFLYSFNNSFQIWYRFYVSSVQIQRF